MKPGRQGRKEAGSQETGKRGQTSVGCRGSEAPSVQRAGHGQKGLRTGLHAEDDGGERWGRGDVGG